MPDAYFKKQNKAGRKLPAFIGSIKLFDFDFSAGFFQLFLDVFSFSFRNTFFQSFRCTVNDVFSFFQTQASDSADNFNHANFLITSRSQYYVEFSFFFSSSCTSTCRASNCNCSSRNAKFFFKSFNQVVQFHYGQRTNGFQNVFFSNSHAIYTPNIVLKNN